MAKHFFTEWNKARDAAQAAGDKWIAEHTQPAYAVLSGNQVVGSMLDLCGRCYVQTKGNTAFGKWCKRTNLASHKWLHFGINHEMRQEMGLHEAMAEAAINSLIEDGITGLSLYQWID